uniref:Secreted protein n=1 Tax=Arundo donax TaxID=35708 RepID=A0A0A9F5W5_ARUDO
MSDRSTARCSFICFLRLRSTVMCDVVFAAPSSPVSAASDDTGEDLCLLGAGTLPSSLPPCRLPFVAGLAAAASEATC